MRILITTDTVGGVWRYTQELAAGLLNVGDSIALVSFGQPPSAAQRAECAQLAFKWGDAFRYSASDLPLEWMQHNERCYEAGAMVIAELAQQFAPHLLHSNQFCFGALELGIPRIVTAHSDVLSWGHACLAGAMAETPWLNRYRRMVQRGLDGAVAVTAPTRWMLHALRKGFRLSCETRIVPNGRTIAPEPAATRSLQGVTAGRFWDKAKDILLLERVCSPVPLLLAGATELDGIISAKPRGLTLLGVLDEPAMLRLFRESAFYICTSLYEPFGLAPLEAALCGCAVIARNLESLEEIWADAALYFHDADDLSELLTWLSEDGESRRKAQQRASARAGNYTREAMVNSYRTLYCAVTEMAGVS